jgi:S1-C subfamily serine protease
MAQIRAFVVTVFAGGGHGSGFFISEKGLLLTNEHVVRTAKLVKIKLTTGREILGEVLHTDARRDVAIVKVEEENMFPLPVRKKPLTNGEEVYAVGTPLSEKFNTTISRGIVSGFRDMDNQKYIQSDVNILPGSSGGPLLDQSGNVVGISVKGVFRGGASTNLNFFIPITSAMQSLNITVPGK